MTTISRKCKACGKEFFASRYDVEKRAGGIFCSRICYGAGLSQEEKFWRKVNKDGPIPAHRPELGPCWLWTAGKFEDGYGAFHFVSERRGAKRRPQRTHRVSWELAHGPITGNLQVLHQCDVRLCVRPAHLFLGTHQENMEDMHTKGRNAHGIRSGMAKITDDQVRQLRQCYQEHGYTAACNMGAAMGLKSRNTSENIFWRKTWKHVAYLPMVSDSIVVQS